MFKKLLEHKHSQTGGVRRDPIYVVEDEDETVNNLQIKFKQVTEIFGERCTYGEIIGLNQFDIDFQICEKISYNPE